MTADLVAALDKLEAKAETDLRRKLHCELYRPVHVAALCKVAKKVAEHLDAPTFSSGHEVGIALAALAEAMNEEKPDAR